MPELTEHDLRNHVGARFAKRARHGHVEEPHREGRSLTARVGPYEVQVGLGDRLSSRCSCIYGERCEHVAAVLAAWLDDPGQFTAPAVTVVLPDTPAGVLDWLRERDPALLEVEVERFMDGGRWMSPRHPLWSADRDDLEVALDKLALAVEEGRLDDAAALAPVIGRLTDAARSRARRREAVEHSRRWREEPPLEPALVPLFESARHQLGALDLSRHPPGSFGRAEILPNGDLRVALNSLPYHPVTRQITNDLLDGLDPFLRRDAAGVVLDSVVGHHQPDIRAAALAILATPAWERALLHLDAALSLQGPRTAPDIGWRLKTMGPLVVGVDLVSLTPFKRKDGYRSKRLAGFEPAELPLPADRAALAAHQAKNPLALVLEQLVDHPRIIDDTGVPLRIRHSTLEVDVQQDDGYTLELRLAGRPVPRDHLHALRREAGRAVLRVGAVVHVMVVGPVLDGLVEMLDRFGAHFPTAARAQLLDRLQLLDRAVPLRLEGPLRGEPTASDPRPVLLLEPLPDGALRVLVRLEPLADGPRVVPGQGASEIARVQDGTRYYVERDLHGEPAAVREALSGLPLPELHDWEGTHELPDDALELVWAVRRSEAVRALWPRRRLRLRGEATASQVTARASQKRDWFGLDGELRSGKQSLSLKDLLAAIRAGQRYVQLDDGSWLRLADRLRTALRDAAAIGTDEATPRLPPLAAARAMLALEEAGGDGLVPDELVDLSDRIRASAAIAVRTPAGLNATLRPYQLEGVTWLRRLASWAPGGILADEMGLGKTLQALALVLDRGESTLVVAPASVNLNWQRETARFAPGLRTALYRGADRATLLDDLPDVLITSYELLLRDMALLSAVRFQTVVFDEAQALKNPRTKRARAARALDAGFVLALTGTPVENNLLELWSLMRTTVPGVLGPAEHFHQRFGKKQMVGPSLGTGNVGSLVRPFLLRRTKRQVAPDLPERIDRVDWIELDARERIVYDRLRLAAVGALTEKASTDRMSVLAALTRLRQAACAERLLDAEAPSRSSKIRRLMEIVQEVVATGRSLLVFSQFTRLLDLAETALHEEGVRTVRLDGSTPLGARQDAVDRFQAREADVFLISLKAGGTGLNLTAATTVVHLDPWWNPAAEDQASDRAHRIGQTHRVEVVRLVSAGTVEERVLDLHDEKRAMADRLFEGTRGTLSLTPEDLLGLLDVG